MLTKEQIKELVDEYPFLWPRIMENNKILKVNPYNYEYCELSTLPSGWINSFIPNFLKELKNILLKYNILNQYYIYYVRSYNGKFEWVGSHNSLDDIKELISKYNNELNCYCVDCGKIPVYRSTWNYFICEDCAKKEFVAIKKRESFVTWDEEFEKISSDS